MPATDYTCLKQLGKGSFGRVFLVRHVLENSLWVMKEIDLTASGDAEKARSDAMKEVNMLSRLDHPNIVKYRECFTTNSPLTPMAAVADNAPSVLQPQQTGDSSIMYIIMEYADSGDLNARIRAQRKPFSEQQILDWFVQLCLAVKHLHDRKCLHRDLKGENVFLGTADRIKLGDFGISKVLPSTFACAMTRIGTPYYLSPEICMNKPYNGASDIWSLGVCLYEMCMLSHPFDASSMEGLLKKIVRSPHRPIHAFYHPELRLLVDALMHKQANKRPSVHEVLRTPIIQREISKWLTKAEYEREFLALPFGGALIDTTTPTNSQSATIPAIDANSSSSSTVKIVDGQEPIILNSASSSVSEAASKPVSKKKSVDSTASWLKQADDLMKAAEEKRRAQQAAKASPPRTETASQRSIDTPTNRESLLSAMKALERERREESKQEHQQEVLSRIPITPARPAQVAHVVSSKPFVMPAMQLQPSHPSPTQKMEPSPIQANQSSSPRFASPSQVPVASAIRASPHLR